MSQPLAGAEISSSARSQFQQYLSRIPISSGAASSSKPSTSSSFNDPENLLHRSTALTSRVDALHAQVSGTEHNDDPQLFWTALTLLTNLRELSAQLQTSASKDRKAVEVLAKTQQNVGIVESLLKMLSVSGGDGGMGNAFTKPVLASVPEAAQVNGYEYYKQQTLSALDSDEDLVSSRSPFDDDDTDAYSDTDSILTDPAIHLSPPTSSSTTKLAGIKPKQEEEDYFEYDRPSKPTPTANPTATNASDTILQSDRATHEALSSELLRMASVLKSNSVAFADALERDRLLLEKAGTDLGQNLDLMTRTRGRLGVYSKKARSMGWFTLSAILVVVVSWMLMFLLIRLT